jgi:hypothetical protein
MSADGFFNHVCLRIYSMSVSMYFKNQVGIADFSELMAGHATISVLVGRLSNIEEKSRQQSSINHTFLGSLR